MHDFVKNRYHIMGRIYVVNSIPIINKYFFTVIWSPFLINLNNLMKLYSSVKFLLALTYRFPD